MADFSVLDIFGGFVAPLSAIFLFILPVIILYKINVLKGYVKMQENLVFVVGILLLFSYFLGKMMKIV